MDVELTGGSTMDVAGAVETEDRLAWQHLTERVGRLQSEARAAQLEKALFEIKLRDKYNLTNGDRIDMNLGRVLRAMPPPNNEEIAAARAAAGVVIDRGVSK
jgi:hypothetical protein